MGSRGCTLAVLLDRDTMLGMLKGPETAFRGWVCSDYDGTRSTVGAANAGLDLAMPGPPITVDFFGAPLRAAVLNAKVRRMESEVAELQQFVDTLQAKLDAQMYELLIEPLDPVGDVVDALRTTGAIEHGLRDKLVFSKVAAQLGLEQRDPDLTGGRVDVGLGEPTLPPEVLEGIGEAIGESGEHRWVLRAGGQGPLQDSGPPGVPLRSGT